MNINDLAKKHDLKKDVDYWQHKQSGQWILKHDAITKIANAENIKMVKIESLYQSDICVRFLITMGLFVDDENVNEITSVGEADTNNCFLSYLGCIAEKRGIDRCVLKLINAYEYGISSEEEAEDFKQKETPKPVKQSGGMSEKARELDEEFDGSEGVDLEKEMGSVADDIKHPINFGKHKGKDWSEVDDGYIKWVAEKSSVEWQQDEAKAELSRRMIDAEKEEEPEKIPF